MDPGCRIATTMTYPGVSCTLQQLQQLHAITPAHQLREGDLGIDPLLLILPPSPIAVLVGWIIDGVGG